MVNRPTFASTSKWIILRITLFASPDFSFPFCIGLRERSIKIFSSALLFLVFVATIVVVAWNHTTIITCTLNFFFYPFAFILYNFFTRYIYISKFLFFFPPRNLLKGNKAGGLWQVLIDPDLNLIILFWDGSLPIEISELIPDEDIILAY